MALPLIGGALLGAALQGLLDLVIDVKQKAAMFRSELEQLEYTLERVTGQVQEIKLLNAELENLSPSQRFEIDALQSSLQNGKILVGKCYQVRCWNVYQKYRYAKKLLKLDTSLVRFFQLDVQAGIWRDARQILLGMQKTHQKLDQLKETGGSSRSGSSLLSRSGGFGSFSAVPEIPNLTVGLDVPLKELKMELFRDGVNVLGLCAPGGCGKTTLASMICQDEQVKGRFKDNIFFLTISSSPNLKTILQRLFEQMDCGFQVDFQNDADGINHLGLLLKQREQEPLLLVLDDVWSESFLQKFVFQRVKYKMLVTSRTAFRTFDSTYTLKMLSSSDSMTLFRSIACLQDAHDEGPDEDLVKKIVRGCNGFPLALKVVAKSLCDQPERKWKSTEKKMSIGSSIFDTHDDLLQCLATSLDFLDDAVRECFFDLGSFPEDYRIPASALIDIWVEVYELDEDDAYVNLLELSSRNLLNLVESTRKGAGDADGNFNELFVIQHDLLRDLAIHQSRGCQNITQSKRLMMDRRGDDLPKSWRDHVHQAFDAHLVSIYAGEMFSSRWLDLQFPQVEVLVLNFSGTDITSPPFVEKMGKLKVLVITNNAPNYASVNGFMHVFDYASNLRRIRLHKISVPSFNEIREPLRNLQKISLVMCEVSHALRDCNSNILNMLPNLIEMDIDYCIDLVELPQWICASRHIQKLSITNCHNLSSLPEELGQMTDLEVLRLHACTRLLNLPVSVQILQKLRYLDISNCSNLEKMPDGLGAVCSLTKLDMRKCSIVKKLPSSFRNLRRLKEVICDEKISFQWELVQFHIPDLRIRVPKDNINLGWLRFDFANQSISS